MHGSLHKSLYYAAQRVRGRPVGARMRTLARWDALHADAYAALASARLKQMLRFARAHVALYGTSHWDKHLRGSDGSSIDVWPVLDRRYLAEERNALVTRGPRLGRLTRSSSASTGLPVRVPWSAAAVAWSWAAEYHPMRWHGLDIGVKTLRLWGTSNRFENWVLNRRFFAAHALTVEELERARRYLVAARPPLIWGVPSAVLQLARYMIQQPRELQRVATFVKVGGEQVYPFQRDEIQRAFGARVIEAYGCTEVGPIAAECPLGAMHVLATNVHVEVFRDGAPAPPGELGDIVVTTLVNEAMPLVRCRIGDSGRLSSEPCACGLPQPVLAELRGRSADLILTVDGTPVHASVLGFALRRYVKKPPLGEVRQILFEQLGRRRWRVQVESDGHADQAALGQQLDELFRDTVGAGCAIELDLVREIEREPSGKFRYYRAGIVREPEPEPLGGALDDTPILDA